MTALHSQRDNTELQLGASRTLYFLAKVKFSAFSVEYYLIYY
jgi:hypothetical protein